MKAVYVLSSVLAAVAGIGATVIITQYLSVKSELAAVKQTAVAQPISAPASAQPVSASAQSVTPAIAQPAAAPAQNFESLPLCDQMDAIAKSGKSVAQFIADSGRYGDFAANVKANCNWNAEQLQTASAILHPPVVTVQKIVRQQTVFVEDPAPQPQPPAPQPPHPPITTLPWNNCNGIQEPGESYSVRCHHDQAQNDLHPNWPKSPHDRDNRETDDFGEKGEANGYLVPSKSDQPASTQPVTTEPAADSVSPPKS